MALRSYSLDFDGYWREPNVAGLPAASGIYPVYACTYDAVGQTVSINRLLYIGESGNVRERISNHECWPTWKRYLRQGEVICISAALVAPEADRQRAEAAMIFHHKPPANTEYVDEFPFDTTTITTSGRNAKLTPKFTVTTTIRRTG